MYIVPYFNFGVGALFRGAKFNKDPGATELVYRPGPILSRNILTSLILNRSRPEKPGPTYNPAAAANQKLSKTERSFEN